MRWWILICFVALAACAAPQPMTTPPNQPAVSQQERRQTARLAAERFVTVARKFEPVAERECRSFARAANCDFLIVIDDRPNQSPNAFQTVDRTGRPILAFNLALISSVANADELAFVMGHEAAHHLLGHLGSTQRNATIGAAILSGIASLGGADEATLDAAEQLGAAIGVRRFSKDFELEADRLGTLLTARAGYDPVRGAAFFNRLPDPGDRFLGTHPPNADRIKTVRQTAAGL